MNGFIGKNSKNTDWVMMVQRLLNATNYCLPPLLVDGRFGKDTEDCVRSFQGHVGLIPDGKVGIKTLMAILSYKPFKFDTFKREISRFLSEDDIRRAAKNLGVSPAVIHAVKEVESLGNGFLNDHPKILFEGHVFWRLLKEDGYEPTELREGNEDILHMRWTRKYYRGGMGEYERLDKAMEIDADIAYQSCSWGLFQIMGYHWKKLKYPSIKHFVYEMRESEAKQLDAFVRYCRAFGLVTHLKKKEWEDFAKKYNGSGYKVNKYHTRLKKAYEKHRGK